MPALNPFSVFSPEGLPASDVMEMFVSDMPGVEAIQGEGHAILVGARGCGKTMILRHLEPDCQLIRYRNSGASTIAELPFFASYLTIKQTDLYYPEFERIAGSNIDHLLNEHMLILTVLIKILRRSIDQQVFQHLKTNTLSTDMAQILEDLLATILGDQSSSSPSDKLTVYAAICKLADAADRRFLTTIDYLDKFVDLTPLPSFVGKLCRFSTVLQPFLNILRRLPGMPASGKLFLLIDDADNLNLTQTRILNTWVSQRLQDVSIKISTQIYEYKTFNTLSGSSIESPHDFTEINIAEIYTSNRGSYYKDRIQKIVERRLQRAGVPPTLSKRTPSARQFFPEDNKQRLAIERISRGIGAEYAERGRGFRPRDDVYRYSRPNYISSLGGSKKSTHRYSYSGFEQLVHLSSGVPRFFLEAAHKMYDREIALIPGRPIDSISPSTQDEVSRRQAEHLYMSEIENLSLRHAKDENGPVIAVRLHNLIGSLGALFQALLLDTSLSERRVFSFALTDTPDDDVAAVLRMGVKFAYFQKSTIGRKEGLGRAERYILTRRLAPMFNLDPNGFTGYKFVQSSELRVMMLRPDNFRNQLRRSRQINQLGTRRAQSEFDFLGKGVGDAAN